MEEKINETLKQINDFIKPLRQIIYEYTKSVKLLIKIEVNELIHDGYCSCSYVR